jgi:hypothetical protein
MEKVQVDDIIGKKIEELRYQSFYLDSELICEISVLFLRLNNYVWYKVTVDDGETMISRVLQEPVLTNEFVPKNEFEYPVQRYNINSLQQFGEIVGVEEYLWNGRYDESCGLLITFSNDKYLSIIEKDECICVENEKIKPLIENCILKQY